MYGMRLSAINLVLGSVLMSAAACIVPTDSIVSPEPEIPIPTRIQNALLALPAPSAKVAVAVYEFTDKTGQFKPNDTVQTLSRAITQGADTILIKALTDAGAGSWFTVVERGNLDNLLKERQIITEMRKRYLGETNVNPNALPPLLFAGVIIEGGVIGFDTNILTGGLGARFLGIGGNVEYRQNIVTIYLRAVSVKTGEVLTTVTARKAIASVLLRASFFKFVSFDDILEIEAGFTHNEPGLVAVQKAIEKGVYGLIMQGAEAGLWSFADQAVQNTLIHAYRNKDDAAALAILAGEPSFGRGPKAVPQTQKTVVSQTRETVVPKTQETVASQTRETVAPQTRETFVPQSQETAVPEPQEPVTAQSSASTGGSEPPSRPVRGKVSYWVPIPG